MFIDVHAHAYRKAPVYGAEGTRFWVTPEKLIGFYDKHQIETGVLMPLLGPEFYPPQPNEDILEAAERVPGRFVPFCNVHPYAMNYSASAPLEITPALEFMLITGQSSIPQAELSAIQAPVSVKMRSLS